MIVLNFKLKSTIRFIIIIYFFVFIFKQNVIEMINVIILYVSYKCIYFFDIIHIFNCFYNYQKKKNNNNLY